MTAVSSPASAVPQDDMTVRRIRAVLVGCTALAVALGAFAALGSSGWVAFTGFVLVLVVAAWTLPPIWLTVLPFGLTPLQLYLTVPGTSFTLRGTVVFVLAAAFRVAIAQRHVFQRALRTWLVPVVLFTVAALVAAFDAPNRYLALKGVWDWMPVFAMLLIAAETVRSTHARGQLITVLVAVGIVEAVAGLVEYVLGLDAVLDLLRLPASGFVFQPDLLHDRLSDLSFNWVIFDRAAPFGTFINGIDYAILIAAVLAVSLALLIAPDDRPRSRLPGYVATLVLAAALLLTFKGSGLLALAAGILVAMGLTFLHTRHARVTSRTFAFGLAVLAGSVLLALPFADLILQRLAFLVQREQGAFGTAGRLEIWASLFQYFIQRPFFGFGLNNAILLAEPMRTLRGGAVAYNTTTPESAYVATLIETGLIGFVALMSLFIATLKRGIRQVAVSTRPALYIAILAGIVALLLGNLTVAGFTTDQNGIVLGGLMGMIWANGIDDQANF